MDDDLVPLCEECHELVHKLHRTHPEMSLTLATSLFLRMKGARLRPPRGKKEKQKRKKKKAHTVSVREQVITFDILLKVFSVDRKTLQWQGYHRAVPVSTIWWWIRNPSNLPGWLGEVHDQQAYDDLKVVVSHLVKEKDPVNNSLDIIKKRRRIKNQELSSKAQAAFSALEKLR